MRGRDSFSIRLPTVSQTANPNRRLNQQIIRALNKIKKPSTAEEIADLLNRELGPGDRPFYAEEVSAWLRNARDEVLNLYWLESRPRR